MQREEGNNWSQWQNYVLKTLEDITDQLKELRVSMVENKVAIGQLMVKSSIWGGIAGLISAAIVLMATLL